MVQLALKRLPPKEAYNRIYRLRRAFQVRGYGTLRLRIDCLPHQCSLSHTLLPKEEQTKPEEVGSQSHLTLGQR